MRDSFPHRSVLTLGWLTGGGIGILAALGELVLQPLAEVPRIPFVIGADGFLGGAFGLACAAVLLPFRSLRRSGLPAVGGALTGVVLAPVLIAALGLFANRVVLSGTHFASPASLALDAVAVVAGILLAVLAGHGVRRFLAKNPRLPAPSPPAAAALLVVLSAAYWIPPRLLARGEPDSGLPSIVLVSIDTLRPDRLSSGGEPAPTSPEIDRITREGVLFAEALAVSPGSAASHAALLTSRYPVSNGVWANFSILDASVTTLAETLRNRGYRTGGFVTNTFLGKRFQFDQGFDAYVESGVVETLAEPSGAAMRRSLAIVQIVDRLRGRFEVGYDPSFETALSWFRETDRPTFFFVQIMDVHSPYVPPHPYGPCFGAERGGSDRSAAPANRFGWRPSVEAYLAEIRFADSKIGRLRRTLESVGIFDDSIVILTSDHGENLVDHDPQFSHGATLFDSTLRILAAFRAPGRIPERRLEPAAFENVDILPSLASLVGWPPSPEWEGRSFFGSDRPGSRVTYSQLNRDFAARTHDWKLILGESGDREFYSLTDNPGEQRPSAASPEQIASLERSFQDWFDAHATDLYLENARSVRPDELSPEIVEKLKGLGYID